MTTITRFISSSFDSAKRRIIKVLKLGKWDVQTPIQISPAGVDSGPIKKNLRAIYCETQERGRNVILGYIDIDQLAQPGEIRIYSCLEDGTLKSYVWCKNDGILHLNGNVNWAVRFNELKEGFDELKSDFNDLVSKYNLHVHTANNTPTATSASSSSASIDDAKNDNIKTS